MIWSRIRLSTSCPEHLSQTEHLPRAQATTSPNLLYWPRNHDLVSTLDVLRSLWFLQRLKPVGLRSFGCDFLLCNPAWFFFFFFFFNFLLLFNYNCVPFLPIPPPHPLPGFSKPSLPIHRGLNPILYWPLQTKQKLLEEGTIHYLTARLAPVLNPPDTWHQHQAHWKGDAGHCRRD